MPSVMYGFADAKMRQTPAPDDTASKTSSAAVTKSVDPGNTSAAALCVIRQTPENLMRKRAPLATVPKLLIVVVPLMAILLDVAAPRLTVESDAMVYQSLTSGDNR